ncbi:MAG: hypothetical protein ACKVOJ_11785 [Sphingomonadaceae bacterium]
MVMRVANNNNAQGSGRLVALAMRWVVALIFLGLAYAAGLSAIVNVTRAASPQTALSVSANDALAVVARADADFTAAAAKGKAIDVSARAAQSLRGEPVNPRAVRLLGFAADAKGDNKNAMRFARLADRLSRRDIPSQMWLLENAVERNDVRAVLARYDIIIRSSYTLRDLLYPKLALALSDNDVRDGFVPYIRSNPAWLSNFVSIAIGASNPDALSYAIRQAGGLPKTDAYKKLETSLLGALFATQKFAEGRAFFETLDGSDRALLTTTAFTDSTLDSRFAPVNWALEAGSNTGATAEKAGKSWAMRAFALSNSTGLAASKYLFLPPGHYRFRSIQTIVTPGTNARASWVLRCMSSPAQPVIYQYDMIRTGRAAIPASEFAVSSDCAVQRLELNLAGGDDSSGLELRLASVTIGT